MTQPQIIRSEIIISETAKQSGFGTDRYKSVTFLTKAERKHARNGGIVAFDSGRLSGGTHGTPWRVVVAKGRYLNPHVPSADVLAVIERIAP